MVSNKDLVENTNANNGANQDAVAEAVAQVSKQAAQDAAVPKKPVTMTESMWSMTGSLKLNRDFEIKTQAGVVTVPAGTEVRTLRRSEDNTTRAALIIGIAGLQATKQYIIPTDAIAYPDAGGSNTVKVPTVKANNDALWTAMQDAAELVGFMPIGESSKSKDAAGWRAQFPGCTLVNVAQALLAVEAFRADRAAKLQTALTGGNEEEIQTAIKELGRGKSKEQDIRSTASNCGII